MQEVARRKRKKDGQESEKGEDGRKKGRRFFPHDSNVSNGNNLKRHNDTCHRAEAMFVLHATEALLK